MAEFRIKLSQKDLMWLYSVSLTPDSSALTSTPSGLERIASYRVSKLLVGLRLLIAFLSGIVPFLLVFAFLVAASLFFIMTISHFFGLETIHPLLSLIVAIGSYGAADVVRTYCRDTL